MPIKKRLLRYEIQLESGAITLTEALSMNIRIKKATLSLQSRAVLEVFGLSQSLRQGLLTQFTAYKTRLKTSEGVNSDDYLNVTISAGYEDYQGNQTITPIFDGQIVLVEPNGAPPEMSVKITAYTNQVDRTTYVTGQPPSPITFKNFAIWCANQMGIGYNIDTSIDSKEIYNPAAGTYIVASLLPWLQAYDRQNIAAWIDNKTLFVRDINKVVNESSVIKYTNFVGSPMWTDWGVNFRIMFDSQISLASGVNITSKLNPSMSTSDLIVMQLEYDLTSRDDSFCINVSTAPSA